jgi:hypothetical protein
VSTPALAVAGLEAAAVAKPTQRRGNYTYSAAVAAEAVLVLRHCAHACGGLALATLGMREMESSAWYS